MADALRSPDDPHVQAWLDQEDTHVAQMIRQHGQSVQYVFGCQAEQPSFAYTIGLFGLGHPELLVFGLEPGPATALLNAAGRTVREGNELLPGHEVEVVGWHHRLIVEAVPNPDEIVFGANRHYRRPREFSVPLFQLTYDDGRGRFPWDAGYSLPAWVQPRPGTFAA